MYVERSKYILINTVPHRSIMSLGVYCVLLINLTTSKHLSLFYGTSQITFYIGLKLYSFNQIHQKVFPTKSYSPPYSSRTGLVILTLVRLTYWETRMLTNYELD